MKNNIHIYIIEYITYFQLSHFAVWVQFLVWEEPRCRRATKPMCYNYWVHALKPASHSYWACVPQVLRPACLEPVLHKKRSYHNEGPKHHKWRATPCSPQSEKGPSSSKDRTAKNKHFFLKTHMSYVKILLFKINKIFSDDELDLEGMCEFKQ